jgi:ADP-heptose:LPS heptosyltransferase
VPPRVLLLRALGLGDFLTGVPAYRAVRRAFPGHQVVLAAPAELAPLVPLTGALDQLRPAGQLQPVEWAGPPPDVAVDLHGRGPASHQLVAALRPRRLIVFGGEHAGGFAGPAFTLVHPGAAAPSRRWPPWRFAAVARQLTADGHEVRITGSAGEHALASRVARQAGLPAGHVLAGQTSLADLAALAASARLVIAGDTGLAHLASAYARPSVTLFGPVPPAEWGPPRHPRHQVLWAGGPGYRGDPHGPRTDPALAAVTVEAVCLATAAALRAPAG